MQTKVWTKSLFLRRAVGAFVVACLALAVAQTGCEQGGEGDRCNPDLSHDECGGGLSCQQPTGCPENYCCPTSRQSANPYCQQGCNGGAKSICKAEPTDVDACAVACAVDPTDTVSCAAASALNDAGVTPAPDAGEGGSG
jgi:hypothetical protein